MIRKGFITNKKIITMEDFFTMFFLIGGVFACGFAKGWWAAKESEIKKNSRTNLSEKEQIDYLENNY